MRKYRAPNEPTERDEALDMLENGNFWKDESLLSACSDHTSPPPFKHLLNVCRVHVVADMERMGWPAHAIESSKFNFNGDYWQEMNGMASYLVENGGWIFEVDKVEKPTRPQHWVKKLGQWHLFDNGNHRTRCGSPMLGSNYSDQIPEHARQECPGCFGKI